MKRSQQLAPIFWLLLVIACIVSAVYFERTYYGAHSPGELNFGEADYHDFYPLLGAVFGIAGLVFFSFLWRACSTLSRAMQVAAAAKDRAKVQQAEQKRLQAQQERVQRLQARCPHTETSTGIEEDVYTDVRGRVIEVNRHVTRCRACNKVLVSGRSSKYVDGILWDES